MMAAPASAAPIAASAISSGVTGRCGDIDGVWIAPVTAQVMMTLSSVLISSLSAGNGLCGLLLVGGQGHQPAIAPSLAFLQLAGRQLLAAFSFDVIQHRTGP